MNALENCGVTRLFAVTSLVRNILSFVAMEAKKKGLGYCGGSGTGLLKPRLSEVSFHQLCNGSLKNGTVKRYHYFLRLSLPLYIAM